MCSLQEWHCSLCVCCTLWQVTLSCTGCASSCGTQTAVSGTLSDGSGTSPYSHLANCEWIIAPPGTVQTNITFTEFSTQANKDFVRVFECLDTTCIQQPKQLAALSGTLSGTVVTSGTGIMKVVFTSDSDVNSAGFSASWNSVSTHLILSPTGPVPLSCYPPVPLSCYHVVSLQELLMT